MLRSAVWFITDVCNMKCPYCWAWHSLEKFHPKTNINPEEWSAAWSRLSPQVLDITGGEPFLVPGFVDLLTMLPESTRVAITTNVKCDLSEFVQRVPRERILSMTISFHPSQMDYDRFLGKAKLLRARKYPVTVNFVTWPEQLYMLQDYKDAFTREGFRFHVDYYGRRNDEDGDFKYTEAERQLIARYIGSDRSNALSNDVVPVTCSAGMSHLQVYPDGTAFRCVNDMHKGAPALGNILDPGFVLNRQMTPCDNYNGCAGCDRDKVTVNKR